MTLRKKIRDTRGETIEQIIAELEARGCTVAPYRKTQSQGRRVWFVWLTQ